LPGQDSRCPFRPKVASGQRAELRFAK
jgi:hypothetical protein